MDGAKKERLESAGWRVGDAEEFLGEEWVPVELDESMPIGSIRIEDGKALVHPETGLRDAMAAHPGIRFRLFPDDGDRAE